MPIWLFGYLAIWLFGYLAILEPDGHLFDQYKNITKVIDEDGR